MDRHLSPFAPAKVFKIHPHAILTGDFSDRKSIPKVSSSKTLGPKVRWVPGQTSGSSNLTKRAAFAFRQVEDSVDARWRVEDLGVAVRPANLDIFEPRLHSEAEVNAKIA